MQLNQEREFYEAHKPDLLQKHRGQFVLIKGDQLVGVFQSAESAYLAGLEKFGVEAFLVRQVLEAEPVGFAPMMSVLPGARL